MNQQPTEINQLGSLWLADSPPALNEQITRLRRAWYATVAWMVIECVVALVGIVLGIWMIIESQRAVGAAAAVFSLFGLTVSLVTRIRMKAVLDRPVAQAIRFSRAELEAQRGVALGGVGVCVGAFCLIAVFAFVDAPSATAPNIGTAISIATLFTAVALAWMLVRLCYINRRRQRLRAVDKFYVE